MTPLLAALAAWGADLPPEMTGAGGAAAGPTALKVTIEDPWKPADTAIAIPAGREPQSVTLTIPARPIPKGKLLVMRFRTRLVTANFAGWNNLLRLTMNGRRIEFFTEDDTPRLLNRRDRSIRTSAPNYPNEPYFKPTAGNPPSLLTAFSHTWDEIEPRFLTDRAELYWYLIDVTDLARADGPNTLELINVAQPKWFKKTAEQMKEQPLLVDSLEIGLVDEAMRDNLVENVDKGIAEFEPALGPVRSDKVEITAGRGGVLRVRRGDGPPGELRPIPITNDVVGTNPLEEAYYVRSSFSEPGASIRHNRFWWGPAGDWKVTVAKRGGTGLSITGTTASYEIRRDAVVDGPFIRLRDTIRNTSGQDLGMMVQHDVIADKPGGAWRLCGLPNRPVHDIAWANPTLHLSRRFSGIGVAIKDSVMRARMSPMGGKRKLSVANDHIGLAKDASYTVEWALYVGGPDFWEFINAVRRDWDANATMPGMFAFWRPEVEPHKSLMADPEKLRAYLKRMPIDVFSITPWFEYYYKPKFWKPRSVYKKTVQDTMRTLKAVQPNAKCIANIESFLYYAPESFFKGTLPKFWTDKKGDVTRSQGATHNFALSEAGTKVIDATPWRDSVFRTKEGRVEIDLYYSTRYKDGGANLKVFPTPDNYWHGRFMDMLDFLINDCGLDGVYIDSFTYYTSQTYDRWDGHTVDVDPGTGKIAKKYARLGLLTAAARREWVKYVTDRGKIVYVNGKPGTAETQDLPMASFMEAEWTFEPFKEPLTAPRAAQAQLSSPLALGIRPHRWAEHKTRYAEIVQKAVIAYLRHGALYCHYTTEVPEPGKPGGGDYGILRHMYPFTPVELHEGWVVGEERILTAVSGTFQWPHAEKPACLRFDIRGMVIEEGFSLKQADDGWEVAVTLKDWNETAVIMIPAQGAGG